MFHFEDITFAVSGSPKQDIASHTRTLSMEDNSQIMKKESDYDRRNKNEMMRRSTSLDHGLKADRASSHSSSLGKTLV